MASEKTTPQPATLKLTGRARERFDELLPELLASGNVRAAETDQVALYCQAWSDWSLANEKLADGLLVRDDKNRIMPSPYLRVREEAAERMYRLAESLGIRPDRRFARPAYSLAEMMQSTGVQDEEMADGVDA